MIQVHTPTVGKYYTWTHPWSLVRFPLSMSMGNAVCVIIYLWLSITLCVVTYYSTLGTVPIKLHPTSAKTWVTSFTPVALSESPGLFFFIIITRKKKKKKKKKKERKKERKPPLSLLLTSVPKK
ncbi:hypothetical protein F4810DRAFT_668177 [Camillea tinctor]|nr:hypothetical protein F4810DRAFT_668177 [Camillea tinctor]